MKTLGKVSPFLDAQIFHTEKDILIPPLNPSLNPFLPPPPPPLPPPLPLAHSAGPSLFFGSTWTSPGDPDSDEENMDVDEEWTWGGRWGGQKWEEGSWM